VGRADDLVSDEYLYRELKPVILALNGCCLKISLNSSPLLAVKVVDVSGVFWSIFGLYTLVEVA
jgi:hypothetical protein